MKKTLLLAVFAMAAAFSVSAVASSPPSQAVSQAAASRIGATAADAGSIVAVDQKEAMSYSIGPVRGASKALVLAALGAAFDSQVLPSQPVHAVDRDAHLSHVERQLALLPNELPEGKEYSASMNGWLSYTGDVAAPEIASCGFGGGAAIVPVEPPKA